MFKKFLVFFVLFFLSFSSVKAEEGNLYITITHTVKSSMDLSISNEIYKMSTLSALPISWMVSSEALDDPLLIGMLSEFKSKSPYQEIGALLDSPKDQLVSYPPKDRTSPIDQYMNKFYQSFGTFPHSVSARHLDSVSMEYLQKKYGLETFLLCDEQYSVDQDKIWGSYVGSPYLPNKNNPLVPADKAENSIPVVVAKSANRDLFHFYGSGNERFYNTNLSDTTQKNLSSSYLNSLIDQYYQNSLNPISHLNFEIENDLLSKQEFDILKNWQNKPRISFVSLSTFGERFLERFINGSPSYFFKVNDPLNQDDAIIYWYQSPKFRIGIKASQKETFIFDLRAYHQNFAEDYTYVKNDSNFLNAVLPYQIDTVQLPNSKQIISETITTSQDIQDIAKKYLKDQPSTNQNVLEGLFLLLILIIFRSINKWGLIFGLTSLMTLWFSGKVQGFGLGFFGPNGHDALFHLSLIRHFADSPFSLSHPQLAGQLISNYHFGLDYFLGIISRLTTLSPISLYFRVFPVLLICLLVSGLSRLLKFLNFDSHQTKVAMFLTFFASSLGWIYSLIVNRTLGGESLFWANQAISYPLNPPLLASLVLLVWFYYFYLTKKNIFLLIFLGAIIAPIKVYAFILLVLALVIERKFKLSLAIFLIGAMLLLPTITLGQSILQVNPFWFIKSLFESPDHLYLPRLAQAIQTYQNSGKLIQLVLINTIGLFLFLIGNFGIRTIGLFQKTTKDDRLAISIIFLGILFPLIFIQASNPWNTIQFIYYSQFFAGLFAARILKRYWLVLAVVLSVIGSLITLRDYFSFLPSSRVSLVELQAIEKLKTLEPGIIISPVFDHELSKNTQAPKPLYAYVSTAYLSALTGFPEYLSDTINLDITLQPYQDRLKNVKRLFQTTDSTWIKKFLAENGIKYIYETPLARIKVEPSKACLNLVIAESELKVYKFDCNVKIKN